MINAKYATYLEQPPVFKVIWKAALYIRLSKDDGDKGESNSVTSQREILLEYLKQHPDMQLQDIYIDDGWSGTNFDRPGFNSMMEAVYSGDVNCVIVKDLSRFGRNYTDAGYYLENVFVRLKVRFIALNNGVDTASNNMNAATQCISVGVTNVINESVAATTSVNVRATLNINRAQGKFIGSFPTYGYLKDPEDHHKLIIDDEAAPVVRSIFERFISGKSIIGIAKELNEEGIPNPSMYKKLKGFNYKHTVGKSNDSLWSDASVRRMLQNQMYIGNMVQGKNTTISYKIKQCRSIPKEDWIIVESTHEAIISKEVFDKAQSLFNKNIRVAPHKKEVDLFSGFVKCADCHRAMHKKTNVHSYGTYEYYRCSTARKMKKSACSNHTIRIDKLEDAVLTVIQNMIDVATDMDDMIKRINSCDMRKKASSHLTKNLETQIAEREKCMELMTDLYPDYKNGVISQEEYQRIKQGLNDKIITLDKNIKSLSKKAQNIEVGISDENEFIEHFKKYGNLKSLSRSVLVELVDEILVHEDKKITIRFKFQNPYKEAMEYIEMNKDVIKTA